MRPPMNFPLSGKQTGGGGFNPLSLFANSEYGALIDPINSDKFQNEPGTTPVTASGQSVRNILDITDNAVALTNPVGMVYVESGGLTYLEGVGTTALSSIHDANKVFTASGGAIFCAVESTVDLVVDGVMGEQEQASTQRAGIVVDNRTTVFAHSTIVDNSGTTRTISYPSQQSPDKRTLILNWDGTTASAYKDNALVGTSTGHNLPLTSNTRLELGHQSVGSLQFNGGKIYYAGWIDRALTEDERTLITAFMQARAGL